MNRKYGSDKYADLHNHTTASDGLLTPTQLVEYAAQKGLPCLAVTDHDTTDGISEAITAGQQRGIRVIPGIELNTQFQETEIHLLGYCLHYHLSWLQDLLAEIRDSRFDRGSRMVKKLQEIYGFDMTFDEVEQEAGEGAVARPHIARVMIRKGYADNMADAFDRYLGTECPAYVDRFRLTPAEGIAMIEQAGGVPVLAHPGLLPDGQLVQGLIQQGIKGIEAYHSKHTPEQSRQLSAIGKDHGLIITGGSDCHGELLAGMPIIGDVRVEETVVKDLQMMAKLHKNN